MATDDLTRLSFSEVSNDFESDSEGFVEDPSDDEISYSYDDTPKLQVRKVASKGRWLHELGMTEVMEKKGKMWTTTGIVRNGKTYCSIEETLFLAGIGALHILNDDDTPVKDIYEKIAEGKDRRGFSWELFQVYRHLKSLGYIVGRHGTPWTSKNIISNTSSAHEGATEFEKNGDITEMFGNLRFGEMRPIFDVFPPNSKFRKSSPGSPSFVLCLTSRPPSKQEIELLEKNCNGYPIKFCNVEHGHISFVSFISEELPVLP